MREQMLPFDASLPPAPPSTNDHDACCDYAFATGIDDTGKGLAPCATCGAKHALMHAVRVRKGHWRVVCRDCLPEGDPRRGMK